MADGLSGPEERVPADVPGVTNGADHVSVEPGAGSDGAPKADTRLTDTGEFAQANGHAEHNTSNSNGTGRRRSKNRVRRSGPFPSSQGPGGWPVKRAAVPIEEILAKRSNSDARANGSGGPQVRVRQQPYPLPEFVHPTSQGVTSSTGSTPSQLSLIHI